MKTVLVVGSGPGGTAAALEILRAGHRVVMLERGDFLPKEDDNRSSQAVYGDTKYRTRERWRDGESGEAFQPWMHYHVGGNAKLYGAALYRFRPADFRETSYPDGISPAWPLGYRDFEAFYDEAENLYDLHGDRAADSTEPTSKPYPHPPMRDEALVAKLKAQLAIETHPLPLGVSLEPRGKWELRLDKFDAYPDPSLGKSDPESRVLAHLQKHGDRFELRTRSEVVRVEASSNGDIKHLTLAGGEEISADCYLLAAGAINSARLLLASGFGESRPLVGANYMAHLSTTGVALFDHHLGLSFAKTFGTNQWYRPDDSEPIRLGSIQTQGKWDATQYELEDWTGSLGTPDLLASQAMEFFFMTEDLPLLQNRLVLKEGGLKIHRKLTNLGNHRKLIRHFEKALAKTPAFRDFKAQLMPLEWCPHQCGTLVFGNDPATSVLDTNCRLHHCENLFVTDGSFFPSSSALNPTLTIIANALRVGRFLGRSHL